MITKQFTSKTNGIVSDTIDTNKGATNNTTHTTFSYEYPKHCLLVHEDVIDYEMQLALREKWKNLTITDNFLFEKVMCNKRVYA